MTMTPADFTRWLLRAPPGERIAYFSGRLHIGTLYNGGRERSAKLAALADRVYTASQGGFVQLTQQRLGSGNYAYLATRSQELAG